ncbi:MAG: NUDIX domain-containing protein [Flavobacteriales bacterium]|nr:NUDIX domain-containing protein [Flavobacteriales bacterium]
MINRFNVRVYFVLVNDQQDSILVADEIIQRKHYTKFPGGGLEFGEGLIECVHREAQEELQQPVQIIRHFYTTDFLVQSVFRPTDQVIPIYFLVSCDGPQQFKTTEKKFNFRQSIDDEESFRWVKITDIHPDDFDFPSDRVVAEMIRNSGLTFSGR